MKSGKAGPQMRRMQGVQRFLQRWTGAGAALLLAPLATLHAANDAPIVGAIRWDGWYRDGNVAKAMESTLGQPKCHFRLPWFARVTGLDKVSIDGDSQSIMEQEIADATPGGAELLGLPGLSG